MALGLGQSASRVGSDPGLSGREVSAEWGSVHLAYGSLSQVLRGGPESLAAGGGASGAGGTAKLRAGGASGSGCSEKPSVMGSFAVTVYGPQFWGDWPSLLEVALQGEIRRGCVDLK